jgi:peptidoglycan/LPS O-acetylase OafA/YrhL
MPLESTAGGSRRRLSGIEGLRGIAAIAVLAYHVWLYAAPSADRFDLGGPLTKLFANMLAGVTLFFVLSGFLLYRPYVGALVRGTPLPPLRGYLRNRALRILPAYWFVLGCVALAFDHELLRRPPQLLANMFFLQDYVPGYMPVSNGIGIVPAWSLCVEVVFYLLLPLLAVGAARLPLSPARRAWAGPAVLVAVGVAAKIAARTVATGTMWDAAFPIHADWFAAGMAIAVARVHWEDGRLRRPRPRAARGIALLGVLTCVGGVELYDKGLLSATEYQTPIAVGFALLLGLLVVGGEQTRVARALSSRALTVAGLGSYSLFLWHDPLLRALRDAGLTLGGSGGFVADLLIVGAVAGVWSVVTYLWVERPALARKTRPPAADEERTRRPLPGRARAVQPDSVPVIATLTRPARSGPAAD